MPEYRWQGIDADGNPSSGTVTAADQPAAVQQCQKQGAIPYTLRLHRGIWGTIKDSQFGDLSADPSDLADFYRAMADGMSTQQPLKQILIDAEATTKKRSNMGRALSRMLETVDQKKPSEVLQNEADVLGPEAAAIWEPATGALRNSGRCGAARRAPGRGPWRFRTLGCRTRSG